MLQRDSNSKNEKVTILKKEKWNEMKRKAIKLIEHVQTFHW